MNAMLIVSGALAAFMVIGHGTLGRSQFFLPMLAADFDPTSKRIMAFVWHMSTITLAVAALALLFGGLGYVEPSALGPLAWYAGVQFLAYGAVHLFLVTTSKLSGAVYKQFQWSLFLAVGGTALLGVLP
ncbi:MAG: hypothetical protein VCE74_06875 [Alphaproteobacteria bacterium]